MRWQSGRRSENIEDRRGSSIGKGTAKLGGVATILIIVVGLATGQDPIKLLNMANKFVGVTQSSSSTTVDNPNAKRINQAQKQQADFVSVILADTEDTWNELLPRYGLQYKTPNLVLFSDQVQSACGMNTSATGPFYCPGDHKVYLDLTFFDTLANNLGAQGDFAQAYVIGHEIGHHIQNLAGISGKVHQAQQKLSKAQANALSVKLELQADCYAGVWANHANERRNLLEAGDKEEGLNAAASIGDDQLLKGSGRKVSPDNFTHGTSKQRVYWLRKGLETGDMRECDTFS